MTCFLSPVRTPCFKGRYASGSISAKEYSAKRYGSEAEEGYVASSTGVLAGLDLDENLPTKLRDCGFTTGIVGKWHLSDIHEYAGTTYEQETQTAKDAGFDFADGFYVANFDKLNTPVGFSHNLEWMTEKALEFLDTDSQTPHFLFYNPTCPHPPNVNEVLNPSSAAKYLSTATPAGTLRSAPDLDQYCDFCEMPERSTIWAESGSNNDKAVSLSYGCAVLLW